MAVSWDACESRMQRKKIVIVKQEKVAVQCVGYAGDCREYADACVYEVSNIYQ